MRSTAKFDRGIVSFTTVGANHVVPMQPWPQSFYVSRTMMLTDAVEVRPLTLTSFAKGVARNFVTMTFWRLLWTLRGLGFLKTGEGCLYGWRDLTPAFWRYQQVRRFRWVRAVERTINRYYESVRCWT